LGPLLRRQVLGRRIADLPSHSPRLAFLMVFLLLSANFLISSDTGCPESICFFIWFGLHPELVE